MNYIPSNPLKDKITTFLSTYLDFEYNQIKLGVWRGNVKFEDVNLKTAAFHNVLNTWKDREEQTISSFLSKKLLLSNNPTPLSYLDLVLSRGSIKKLDVVVPWPSILKLGSSRVRIELEGVTIRLDLKSCIIEALEQKDNGLLKIFKSKMQVLESHQETKNTRYREWKQSQIKSALRQYKKDKTISHEIFEEKSKTVDSVEVNDPESVSDISSSTFVERIVELFVESFASNLSWRIGKLLEVEVKDLQIILVQDDIEIGLLTESIKIYEFDIPPTRPAAAKEMKTQKETTNVDDNSIPTTKSNEIPKSPKKLNLYTDFTTNVESQQSIKKSIDISSCGLFIRTFNELSTPVLDEHFFLPTNVNVIMSLSRDGADVKVCTEIEEAGTKSNDNNAIPREENYEDSTKYEKPKERRGKRDKRKFERLSLQESQVLMRSESTGTEKSDYLTVGSGEEKGIIESSTDTIFANNDLHGKPNFKKNEIMQPHFSTEIVVDTLTMVLSSQTLILLNKFTSNAMKTLIGRPAQRIQKLKLELDQNSPRKNQEVEKHVSITNANTRKWWSYAIINVLRDMRKKRYLKEVMNPSEFDLTHHQRLKRTYISLYSKTRLQTSKAEGSTEKQLLAIEDRLTVEQIILFRSSAENDGENDASSIASISSLLNSTFDLHSPVSSSRLTMDLKPININESRNIPQRRYRKHKSLFDTGNIEKLGHTREKTLKSVEDQVVYKEMQSASQHPIELFPAIKKTESYQGNDSLQPAFQGKISSLLTISITSFQVFICKKAEMKPTGKASTESNDDMSALTSNTFDFVLEDESESYNDLQNYDFKSERMRIVSIFGLPHEIIFSSNIHQVELSEEDSEERKLRILGIDGLCCQLCGSSSISSGTLRSLDVDDQFIDEQKYLKTVDSLALNPFYAIDETKENFLSIKIVKENKWNHKTGDMRPFHVQNLVAKLCMTLDCSSLPFLFDYWSAEIQLLSESIYTSFPMSEFDRVRQKVWTQISVSDNSLYSKEVHLYCEMQGIEIVVLVDCADIKNPSEPKLINRQMLESIQFDISKMSIQNNGNGKKGSHLIHEYTKSFPTNHFHNMLLTLENIKVKTGTLQLLENPQDIEMLLSLPKSCDASDNSVQNLTLLLSPLKLLVSKNRLQKLNSLVAHIKSSLYLRQNHNEKAFVVEVNETRITELAKVTQQQIKMICSSVEVKICDDKIESSDHKWAVILKSIFRSLLLLDTSLSPQNDANDSNTMNSAIKVAMNRMRGLGFPHIKAEALLDMLSCEFNRLRNGKVDSTPNFKKSAISNNNLYDNVQKAIDNIMPIIEGDSSLKFNGVSNVCLVVRFGIEMKLWKLTYDWRVTISLPVLQVCNGMGVCHFSIEKSAEIVEEVAHDFEFKESAVSIVVIRKDSEGFGKGGSPLHLHANDLSIVAAKESLSNETEIISSIGLVEMLFLDDEMLRAINLFVTNEHMVKKSNCKKPIVPITIQGNISKCDVMFCTNKYEPFVNIVLECIVVDAASNPTLFEEGQSFSLSATSKRANMFDLSSHGQGYDHVISGDENEDTPIPFRLQLAKSCDESILPTELLVVFSNTKVIILRRFINEMLQYFLSQGYGVGRIIHYMFHNTDVDVQNHPIRFQVHLNNSSIVLPKHSRSCDLVGVQVAELILSNSFEKESWINTSCTDVDRDDNFSCFEGGFLETINENFVEAESFDKSLIPRIKVRITNADVFTGICKEHNVDLLHCVDSFLPFKHALRFGEINDGDHVFVVSNIAIDNMTEDDRIMLNNLTTRQWEKVTTHHALSIEVTTDFVPDLLRVLIKDAKSKYDFPCALNLRMSQFYTLLSIWYENMQELPLLFPYSPKFIHKNVNIPACPADWPDYGSAEFVQRLNILKNITFELALSLTELDWQCRFDRKDYFGEKLGSAFMFDSESDHFILNVKNFLLQVDMNSDGVMRTSVGATSLVIEDYRHSRTHFHNALTISPERNVQCPSLDMKWGLNFGRSISSKEIDFPFQATIFMTPDKWCLVNLAMEDMDSCTSDLGVIWILLDYFSCYYLDGNFGNPYFSMKENTETILKEGFGIKDNIAEEPLNIDFRLWLIRPRVVVLNEPTETNTSAFVIKSVDNCLSYRYKTIGHDHVSQEVCCRSFDMLKLQNYKTTMEQQLDIRSLCVSGKLTNMLLRSLDMVLIYDQNTRANYTDIHVEISKETQDIHNHDDGIEFSSLKAVPLNIPLPTICKPILVPSHQLGPISCEIDLMNPDDFISASESLQNFAGPYNEGQESEEKADIMGQKKECEDESSSSFNYFINICGMKIFICDPLLGVHLPIVVANISNLKIHCSQLHDFKINERRILHNPTDFQICVDAHFWVDYYKSGPTRSWEPLVEPFKCIVLYEKSRRGNGITFNSRCPFHINMSGAFFETLTFAARSFAPKISTLLGLQPTQKIDGKSDDYGKHEESQHEDHSKENENKSAFVLINLTGDNIRYHQRERKGSTQFIQYLGNRGAAVLSFPATRSLVMNLSIVEIPVYKNGEQIINDAAKSGHVDSSNYINLQVPGFQWSRSINVDVTGKNFVGLHPKSHILQNKLANDWKLANALSMLTDVSFHDGGRKITISSTFEILNKTTHRIQLASHPDPLHLNRSKYRKLYHDKAFLESDSQSIDAFDDLRLEECYIDYVTPGKSTQVPLFLLESSLQQDGKNIGSFWCRPLEDSDFIESLDIRAMEPDHVSIGFCSSPIELLHLVDESAHMFTGSNEDWSGLKSFSSGYQLSCPMMENKQEKLPFCYCIEVKRSPILAPFSEHGNDHYFEGSVNDNQINTTEERSDSISHKSSTSKKNYREIDKKKGNKNDQQVHDVHGPVAYTLEIHPPIIIENLLPEDATYELMHATSKEVVWSKLLLSGDKASVYTVGLDAPLLLLINANYCRTPVGEGALVHHGLSPNTSWYGNKYYSSHHDLNADKIINEQLQENGDKTGKRKVNKKAGFQGQIHREENEQSVQIYYTDQDIATETTLVDHLGQKINLSIENKFGQGGQRHVTIFCPYWIVNTTEHALRYRQEKASSYVSGTKVRASQDGSRFVDSENADSKNDTIFPGKPGALATPNLSLDMFASLMEKDMPIHRIASMAFMFNFFRDGLSIGGYERKVCIQLADPTGGTKYESEWSKGVSLESVGVPQPISMHCVDGRHLEIVLGTRVAPGRLSHYTKIVRLSPKYVLVNQLYRPIRLWQDSSLVHPSRTLDDFTTDSKGTHKWESSKGETEDSLRKYDCLFKDVAQLDYRRGTKMRSGTVADRSARYITTVGKGEMISFHLPDTKFDRELRIDIGRQYNLSASFPCDITSEHTLKMVPVVDLRILKYVNNRAAARYNITLPPEDETDQSNWDGELGLWFESIQWGHGTKIVVKGTKRGKYSINNTEIHVGDELVQIDDEIVNNLSFKETMSLLKKRVSEVSSSYQPKRSQSTQSSSKITPTPPRPKKPKFRLRFKNDNDCQPNNLDMSKEEKGLTLVFQTLEYRMKKLRSKALGRKNVASRTRDSKSKHEDQIHLSDDHKFQVSLKYLYQSIFVFLHDVDLNSPYHVENQSPNHIIYFRQKGCEHHQWNSLGSGDSVDYSWEEPMKPHKLSIRVGIVHSSKKNKKQLPFKQIENEDQAGFGASKIVQLDEIGSGGNLPFTITSEGDEGTSHSSLDYRITSDGKTKKLVISEKKYEDTELLRRYLDDLSDQISDEKKSLVWLQQQVKENKIGLSTVNEEEIALTSSETTTRGGNKTDYSNQLKKIIDTADNKDVETITSRDQVLIEVVEASGLRQLNEDSSRPCSPYCTIRVIRRSNKHRSKFMSSNAHDLNNVRRTYFIDKSDSPKWSGMKFIFDVPQEAKSDPQGHSVLVKVKDHRLIGKNASLGMTEIRLQNLKHQKEVFGWYPLMARTGRGSESLAASTGGGSGSVKIRIQWIHSNSALLDYYILLSENHIDTLSNHYNGINKQLNRKKNKQKEERMFSDFGKGAMSMMKKGSQHIIHGSLPNKAKKIFQFSQQKNSMNINLPLKFHEARSPCDQSSGTEFERESLSSDSSCGLLEIKEPSVFEGFEYRLLPAKIICMQSWLQAQDLLNNSHIKKVYNEEINEIGINFFPLKKMQFKTKQNSLSSFKLPSSAPKTMQTRRDQNLKLLYSSRDNFEKAAQRSFQAVRNPGGLLTIRPITALYLQSKDFIGMYVKIRYGSLKLKSKTVHAPVNPEWSPSHHKFEKDESMSVFVHTLNTNGSLRLSVVGVKKGNSKEELGVLRIPLADAISCCTEKFDSDDNSTNCYVRWFPLTDPKWTDSVDLGVPDSPRSIITETTDSTSFSEKYTKCIKLEMQWKDDDRNVFFPNETESQSTPHIVSNSYFHVAANRFSAAIIDSFRSQELLSLELNDITIRKWKTKQKTWIASALGGMQVDHHGEQALEPIVLSPTPVMHPHPIIRFFAARDNVKSKTNVDSFEHVEIRLEELDLKIEESWVFDLWDMYLRLQKRFDVMQKSIARKANSKNMHAAENNRDETAFSINNNTLEESHTVIDAITQMKRDKDGVEAKMEKKFYIEHLILSDVKLNISYIKSIREKVETTLEYGDQMSEIFRRWSEFGYDEDYRNDASGKSRHDPMIYSAVFPAISDAPVYVNEKFLEYLFVTWSELVAELKSYYSSQIKIQFLKVIGSLDMVGNPMMHVTSVLKGARDFFVIPLEEILRSPQDASRLGIGVAKGTIIRPLVGVTKGTVSLFSNSFSGVFGFTSKISEAVGSGVAQLSFDDLFKRRRAEQLANHARHRNLKGQFRHNNTSVVVSALKTPIQDLGEGLFFAARGLVVEPFQGAKTKGVKGFASGVGTGTVGLVTKPIVGLFDAFAHISESFNDAARSANFFAKTCKPVAKSRSPYIFGYRNILLPYNMIHAHTTSLLLRFFPIGKEILVVSEILLLNSVVVTYLAVTNKRIILFEVQIDRSTQPKSIWQIDFDSTAMILSRLENYRQSGYELRIQRVSLHQVKQSSMGRNEIEKLNNSGTGLEIVESLSPKKKDSSRGSLGGETFRTLYEQAGTFLPINNAFASKQDSHVKVQAPFAYRKELARVHNAICCLTRHFESIVPPNIADCKDLEGCTSFGNMHFIEEEISSTDFIELEGTHQLEGKPWHFSDNMQQTIDLDRIKQWNYCKNAEDAKQRGGPRWLIDSRARTTFIPLQFPSLPLPLNFDNTPALLDLKEKLQKGEISFLDAEVAIQQFAKSLERERDTCPPSHEFSYITNNNNNVFFSSHEVDMSEHDIASINNTEARQDIQLSNMDHMSYVDRLSYVEKVLDNLIIKKGVVTLDNTGIVSAMSNSDNLVDDSIQRSDTHTETEGLKKQVEELTRKLELAQNQADSTSTSTGIRREKKRKRKLKRKK